MSPTPILIIIGPTAVGKSSIIEKVLRDYPRFHDVITYTTRPLRSGESEGNPYHFVSEEQFQKLKGTDFFLEFANVHGRHYGTPRDQFESAAHEGRPVIIDIDVQGAKALLKLFPWAISVFLLPPSKEALRHRFIKRGVTDQADLDRRLESAAREMAQAQDFKHVLVNDDLEATYRAVRAIIDEFY